MLRRYLAFLFALTVVLSCADNPFDDDCEVTPPPPSTIPADTVKVYKIIIHSDVPGSKVGPILDAAAEWTTATDGAFAFEATYGDFDPAESPKMGEMRVYLAPKTDPNSGIIGTAHWWSADAEGRPGRSRIWIQDNLDDRTHYLVAVHEIGHALGLDHSTSTSSIMYPSITDVGDHIPCIDRKEVCKIWGCTPGC